jgi:hypothetical protein
MNLFVKSELWLYETAAILGWILHRRMVQKTESGYKRWLAENGLVTDIIPSVDFLLLWGVANMDHVGWGAAFNSIQKH